jgi:hypothetical protein
MAYFGSTQASSAQNPPVLVARGIGTSPYSTALSTAIAGGKQGAGLWFYSSTNGSTDTMTAGFFSDAKDLGMRPGDVVLGFYYSSAASSCVVYIGGITGVSTAGAALSTGGTMTSTFA